MKKRKTSAKNHINKSGETRQAFEYQAEFDAIASIDDLVDPECVRGVGNVVYKKNATTVAEKICASSSKDEGKRSPEETKSTLPKKVRRR